MVKAVFIDYMGTTVDEHSPEMAEIVRRICKNSNLHDPKQVQRFILDTRRRYETNSYLGTAPQPRKMGFGVKINGNMGKYPPIAAYS